MLNFLAPACATRQPERRSSTNGARTWPPARQTDFAGNRLTRIEGPHGSAAFKYDPLGRRPEKTLNGRTTQYLYDGAQAIAELHGSAIGATYLTGLAIDEILAR